LNGLPPGTFPLNVFNVVLNAITIRGSIVGTRRDLQEALEFAGAGRVKAIVEPGRLEDINAIFHRMHEGKIEGRIVLDMAA
jgi:propanol-preferring alcohol dehydrogenase